jgi:DNA-directed RNA polymerase subunit omega
MAQGRLNLMDPPIEDLLDKVDSKFTLVALGALRARQVNAYYNSLGEGLGRVVPPQVASVSGKPLSIAFEEIAAGKATYVRLDPEELAAAEAAEAAGAEPEGAAMELFDLATETAEAIEAIEAIEIEAVEAVEAIETAKATEETPVEADEPDGEADGGSEDEGPAAS